MKKEVTVLLAIILFSTTQGCSPASDEKVSGLASSNSQTTHASVFANTSAYDAPTLIKAAAALIHSGGTLSSEMAERCFTEEKDRTEVREACLLAWATGDEASERLEGELRANGHTSRGFALAAIRRKHLIEKASYGELLRLLEPLRADPPWVRAVAMEGWLKHNNSPSVIESQALWATLGIDPRKNPRVDPASGSAAYRLALKLNVGRKEELLTAFCSPSAESYAQVRCWRFLSTLVDPLTGQGLDQTARAFLPIRREDGWVLFERSFPERALILHHYR